MAFMFVLPIVPGALFSKTVQSAFAPKEIQIEFRKKITYWGAYALRV